MNFLAEIPWIVPVLLAFAGAGALVTGRNQGNRNLLRAGLAALLLAALLVAVSAMLDSDREAAIKRTRALVQAVERRDWSAMGGMLAPDVQLLGTPIARDALVAVTRLGTEQYDLSALKISALNGQADDQGGAKVVMQVVAHGKNSTQPTGWEVEWRKRPDGQWSLVAIDARDAPGFSASMVRGFVARRALPGP